jgi:cell division protein FtsB
MAEGEGFADAVTPIPLTDMKEAVVEFLKDHWKRVAASVALLFVLFGNQGFHGLVRNWLELRHLRGEIAELNRQEAAQTERLKALRSGGSSFERLARSELGYIRKGEIEYRFPPPVEEKK